MQWIKNLSEYLFRSSEAISSQLQVISGSKIEEVNKHHQHESRATPPNRSCACQQNGNKKTCRFYHGEHVLKEEKCPAAWGTKCSNCGDQNHFVKTCRKLKISQRSDTRVKQIETSVKEPFESDSDSSDVDFITSITTTVIPVNSESPPTSGYTKQIYQLWNRKLSCRIPNRLLCINKYHYFVIVPTTKRLVTWNKTEI